MLVERVAPVYPEAALQEKLTGEVLLLVVVNPEGKVQRAHHLSGNPFLAEAAETAVKKWRYKPHMVEGLPLEFETEVRLKFPSGIGEIQTLVQEWDRGDPSLRSGFRLRAPASAARLPTLTPAKAAQPVLSST
ncbi:MAG: energy transducer TonB [Terriglobales bacterium]